DFGKSSDGTVFFVMEFLRGEPLDGLLQRERRLELLRAITIINQIAGALGAAHAKGIVHRDLKPENIMLTPREGRRELIRQISDETGTHTVSEREKAFDFVKILDFGVAKVRDPNVAEGRVTQQGVVFGTPEYMAPETARIGVSDPRTDVYALGVIFYEILTGTIPFAGETAVDVMLKVVSEPVIPPRQRAPAAEITPEAESLIMRALAKDPLKRHQSMEELRDELQQCYGSVRFRRSLERSAAQAAAAHRPSGPAATVAAAPTAPQVRFDGTNPGIQATPILLTKKKERRKTLPMDLRGEKKTEVEDPPPAPRPSRPAIQAVDHDEWSEPALRTPPATAGTDEWTDLDIDT